MEALTTTMRAVITDPNVEQRLVFGEMPLPVPSFNQALVKVTAFSLNAGETRTALAATSRYTPGWDFAGVIEVAAADGSTPKAGTRVFGFVPGGAWAAYIAVRNGFMAHIPEGITDVQAAALPVAGATAMICLEEAGPLLHRRVLITGAAGGVGRFACQLAALAGAQVFAISRRPELPAQLRSDGVIPAGVFTTIAEAKAAGTYDVILDSVGGETLGVALTALAMRGICINCGNSSCEPTTFDARDFYLKSDARLRGVWLGSALSDNCTPILTRLVGLVKQGRLKTPIDAEEHWADIAAAAVRLVQQTVNGKIIMKVA